MTTTWHARENGITAIILAGGRGERMGGEDKGWVHWRGQPLVQQVLERLTPQVSAIVISCNRNLARYRSLGHPCVLDSCAGFPGPLAGVAAAMPLVATARVLLCPCDTPLLPPDLAPRLARAMDAAGSDSAIPRHGEHLQYAHALLSSAFAASAEHALGGHDLSLARWLAQGRQCIVDFYGEDDFRNINRPEDLA